MTLNAWTGGLDPSSPRKDRSTGIPPKLTPEQIDDIDQGMCGERECVQPFAQGVADARDQQWLDMLSAVPGTEKIMDMLDNFEYAVLGVMQGRRSPDEPAQMKADIRAAIEQALESEGVAAHLNGYREAERALAACRDVFAPPEPGTEAERQWAQAMVDPESVPAYIKHRKEVFESVLRQALAALEQVAAWEEGGRRMAQEAIAAIRKCVGK